MLRTETRRRGQNHHVDAAVEHGLVGIEADEAALGLDLHPRTQVVIVSHVAQFALDVLGIDVGDGGKGGVLVRPQRVQGGLPAPSATADEADADFVAGRGG